MDILRWKNELIALGLLGVGLVWNTADFLGETDKVSVLEFIFDTVEKALIIAGAGGVFLLLQQMRSQQKERQNLVREIEVARVEGGDWRRRAQIYMNGVGEEIEKQFREWGLSEAEHEVGLMMIKGLSHKEIAELRGTAEATVRQQARNIYQKSKLPGKAAFSAYFLEDLLPPSTTNPN